MTDKDWRQAIWLVVSVLALALASIPAALALAADNTRTWSGRGSSLDSLVGYSGREACSSLVVRTLQGPLVFLAFLASLREPISPSRRFPLWKPRGWCNSAFPARKEL